MGKPGRGVQNQHVEVKFEPPHTISESLRRRPDSAGPRSQCIDLEIVHVNDNEKLRFTLETSYKDNLFTYRNTNFEALKTSFDMTQLILNQKHEIRHDSTIEWQFTQNEIYLATSQICQVGIRKAHVYSDSFLSGKDARTSGCHREVARTTSILSEFMLEEIA